MEQEQVPGDEAVGRAAGTSRAPSGKPPASTTASTPTALPVLRVLATSLRMWRANLLPFTALALVIHAPTALLRSMYSADDWALYGFPIGVLFNSLVAGAITYGVVMELNGARPSFRRCIATGLSQLPRILGVVGLSTLAIMGGLLLLVIPGLILMLMLWIIVPIAIIERLSPVAALRRSRELTNGHKGDLFLILLVTLGGSIGLALALAHYTALSSQQLDLAGIGLDAVFGLFGAITAAVSYTMLRHAKEGTQPPEIATAFARIVPRPE